MSEFYTKKSNAIRAARKAGHAAARVAQNENGQWFWESPEAAQERIDDTIDELARAGADGPADVAIGSAAEEIGGPYSGDDSEETLGGEKVGEQIPGFLRRSTEETHAIAREQNPPDADNDAAETSGGNSEGATDEETHPDDGQEVASKAGETNVCPHCGQRIKPARKAGAKAKKASTRTGPTKTSIAVDLLKRKEGTTTREILDATGWPAVSVPAIAARADLTLRQEKDGRVTRYWAS
jgi:hypothetical protein